LAAGELEWYTDSGIQVVPDNSLIIFLIRKMLPIVKRLNVVDINETNQIAPEGAVWNGSRESRVFISLHLRGTYIR
jgi:hypothetical protein